MRASIMTGGLGRDGAPAFTKDRPAQSCHCGPCPLLCRCSPHHHPFLHDVLGAGDLCSFGGVRGQAAANLRSLWCDAPAMNRGSSTQGICSHDLYCLAGEHCAMGSALLTLLEPRMTATGCSTAQDCYVFGCVVLCCNWLLHGTRLLRVWLCCAVVLCCVVLCCVVLCCVVLCCVVLCCVVFCCVVLCRRRCYQKAKAGMSTHGYR